MKFKVSIRYLNEKGRERGRETKRQTETERENITLDQSCVCYKET